MLSLAGQSYVNVQWLAALLIANHILPNDIINKDMSNNFRFFDLLIFFISFQVNPLWISAVSYAHTVHRETQRLILKIEKTGTNCSIC